MGPLIMTVTASLPARSVADVIALASHEQPSGSMWPFASRLNSPCARTRRHGAEILPMDSLPTSTKEPTP
jgi:hypothetical protein